MHRASPREVSSACLVVAHGGHGPRQGHARESKSTGAWRGPTATSPSRLVSVLATRPTLRVRCLVCWPVPQTAAGKHFGRRHAGFPSQ